MYGDGVPVNNMMDNDGSFKQAEVEEGMKMKEGPTKKRKSDPASKEGLDGTGGEEEKPHKRERSNGRADQPKPKRKDGTRATS